METSLTAADARPALLRRDVAAQAARSGVGLHDPTGDRRMSARRAAAGRDEGPRVGVSVTGGEGRLLQDITAFSRRAVGQTVISVTVSKVTAAVTEPGGPRCTQRPGVKAQTPQR